MVYRVNATAGEIWQACQQGKTVVLHISDGVESTEAYMVALDISLSYDNGEPNEINIVTHYNNFRAPYPDGYPMSEDIASSEPGSVL